MIHLCQGIVIYVCLQSAFVEWWDLVAEEKDNFFFFFFKGLVTDWLSSLPFKSTRFCRDEDDLPSV